MLTSRGEEGLTSRGEEGLTSRGEEGLTSRGEAGAGGAPDRAAIANARRVAALLRA